MEDIRLKLCDMPSAKKVSAFILALNEEKLLTISLLWSWWNAQNKVNVGEKRLSTDEIVYQAHGALISPAHDMGKAAPISRQCVWTAPSEDFFFGKRKLY